MTRVSAALKKCPMCKDVYMFNIRKFKGIQLPSTQLISCNKFKGLAFVTTIGVEKQDAREKSVTRAAATLVDAKKCPVCKDVHMFNIHEHTGIKFSSTQQTGCALCTLFVNKRETCHLKRRVQAAPTCGV